MRTIQTIAAAALLFVMFGVSASAQEKRYPPPPVVITTSTLPSVESPNKTTPSNTTPSKTSTNKKRPTRKTTASKAAPIKTSAKIPDSSPEPKTENVATTQKVSNQITNVTKFLYLLGGIAKSIDEIDKDKRANAQAIAANNENKKEVQQTIRNLRAGLAALETDFRSQPALRRYLTHIDGISELAGQAETLAMANRFGDAGRPLVTVVGKLADALAEMP